MANQEKLDYLILKGKVFIREKGGYWSGSWTGKIGEVNLSYTIEKQHGLGQVITGLYEKLNKYPLH